MSEPSLSYVPREDATREGEIAALAAVYVFVLERYDRGETAAWVEDGENAVGHSGGPSAERSIGDGNGGEDAREG